MQDVSTSLPTLYYPFLTRKNWRYWIKLSNGTYYVKQYTTVRNCCFTYEYCKRFNIPFKATPMGEKNTIGMKFASFLNLTCSLRG